MALLFEPKPNVGLADMATEGGLAAIATALCWPVRSRAALESLLADKRCDSLHALARLAISSLAADDGHESALPTARVNEIYRDVERELDALSLTSPGIEKWRSGLDHRRATLLGRAPTDAGSSATKSLRKRVVEAELACSRAEAKLSAQTSAAAEAAAEAGALMSKLERSEARVAVLTEQLDPNAPGLPSEISKLNLTQAKLELEAAHRTEKKSDGEKSKLRRQLHDLSMKLRSLEEDAQWANDELAKQANSTAGKRLVAAEKEARREAMLRRRAEASEARANKEIEALQRRLAEVSADAAEARAGRSSGKNGGALAEEEAAEAADAARREAALVVRSAEDKLTEAQGRSAELEAQLSSRDSRIADLEVMVGAREAEVRAQGRKELLKQAAELERLRTMMAWKAKIVEDDVKFRTEAEWRERARALVREIENLRTHIESIEMDKEASDGALREAAQKLSVRGQEIEGLRRTIAQLSAQLSMVDRVQETAERLHRGIHEHWHSLNDSRIELQREQRHFRQRRAKLEQEQQQEDARGSRSPDDNNLSNAVRDGRQQRRQPREQHQKQQKHQRAERRRGTQHTTRTVPTGWR